MGALCGIRFVSGNAESEISELRGVKPSDYAQYIRYKDRLGENNVGSIDSFIDLKYNKIEEWLELQYLYRNINGRPIEYAKIDYELELLGINNKGKAYPVENIEIQGWRLHAEKRCKDSNLSKSDTLKYKTNAIAMMKKYPEPNTQYNYYSESGVVGIRRLDGIVCTVIGPDRIKSDTKKIIEVMSK